MPLDSPKYLGFLLLVWTLFQWLPAGRCRRLFLLAASYGFYIGLSGIYAVCLVLVSAVGFGGALALQRPAVKNHRGKLLATLCLLALAPLLCFKYLAFMLGIAAAATGIEPPSFLLSLLLPIGISFFTFAALGYLIDVYLEVVDPVRDPLRIALFLAFFPVITAGPIERANGLLPQLEFDKPPPRQALFDGLRLIFIGLVLKVVFANTLAAPVNAVYQAPASVIPLEKVFTLIFYMFYVYADFAGYSLIAIGSALLFGLRVRPNFHQPFLSETVSEFWRNWHMSLSFWVRDYIFSPLRMRWRDHRDLGLIGALLVAFLVIGIWHGAGWGYVLFGLAHGIVVSVSTLTLAKRDRVIAALGIPLPLVSVGRMLVTFVVVMLIFVLYRAHTLEDAATIYSGVVSPQLFAQIATLGNAVLAQRPSGLTFKAISPDSMGWLLIGMIAIGDVLARRRIAIESLPRLLRYALYNLGAAALLYMWATERIPQPFQYYNF